jgi:hypothetical protein
MLAHDSPMDGGIVSKTGHPARQMTVDSFQPPVIDKHPSDRGLTTNTRPAVWRRGCEAGPVWSDANVAGSFDGHTKACAIFSEGSCGLRKIEEQQDSVYPYPLQMWMRGWRKKV